jgi:HAD superfamily hydrolase (TIGR01549 family)
VRRYDAILFDAGNTLVHLDHARVAEIAGQGIDEVAVWRGDRAVRTNAVLLSQLSGGHLDSWRTYMEFALEAAGLEKELAINAATRVFQAHLQRNLWRRVQADVEPTLRRLRAAGYVVGVVSNAEGTVAQLLHEVGLASLLDFVIDSHYVGFEKPDPRIFALALERAGTAPERTLYVGDIYAVDVVGARGAGMDAALLDSFGVHRDVDCPRLFTLGDVLKLVGED